MEVEWMYSPSDDYVTTACIVAMAAILGYSFQCAVRHWKIGMSMPEPAFDPVSLAVSSTQLREGTCGWGDLLRSAIFPRMVKGHSYGSDLPPSRKIPFSGVSRMATRPHPG